MVYRCFHQLDLILTVLLNGIGDLVVFMRNVDLMQEKSKMKHDGHPSIRNLQSLGIMHLI